MSYLRSILTALILTALVPATIQAQEICAPRDIIIQTLKKDYNEARGGMGLKSKRIIVELWVSEATGTWTIIMSNPEGWTCVITSGVSWRIITPDYATPITATSQIPSKGATL